MSLKPDYRIVITLFYIEGLSYKELSALLQISEQAVSQRLARARKNCFNNFKIDGVVQMTSHEKYELQNFIIQNQEHLEIPNNPPFCYLKIPFPSS